MDSPPDIAADASRPRVSRGVLVLVFLRSLLLQAGFNPRAMQGLGFTYALFPALEALYPDPEARKDALRRHLVLFNTHPYFAAAILGGAVRLEERVAGRLAPADSVRAFRDALAAPLAAIGDAFFWNALRPACALFALLLAPAIGLWSVALFLGLYNAVHLSTRVWLFTIGYREAEAVVGKLGGAHFPVGTVFLRRAAAALAGAALAQAVLLPLRQSGPSGSLAAALAAAAALLLGARTTPYLLALAALALSLAAGILL